MNNHKNVLILDPAGNMWGSERVLLDFIGSGFIQAGSFALCCPAEGPLAEAAVKTGLTVFPYFEANLHKRGKFARFIAAIGLYVSCRKFRADVIYVNQAGATRIALIVGRILGIPVVPHVRLLEDVWYLAELVPSEEQIPHVIVVSEFIGRAFDGSKLKSRVRILYDAYKFSNKTEMGKEISPHITRLCCAGRLVPIKGQHVLIEAVSLLKLEGIFVRLDFFGTSQAGERYEDSLRKLVVDLDLSDDVTFHGFVNDITAEMKKYQVVICPSEIEPLGRVIFEAWDAHCVPIVGAFSGGGAEVISKSGGGVLYLEQTPDSLAAAIKKCLQLTREQREDLVYRGRHWLMAHCNPEVYARRLNQLFSEDGESI